jgi:hypothetical protein
MLSVSCQMTAATFPVHRDLAGFNLAASRAAKPQVQHLQLKVKAVVHDVSDHKIYKPITAIAIYYKQLIRLRPAQIGMNSISKIDFQGGLLSGINFDRKFALKFYCRSCLS